MTQAQAAGELNWSERTLRRRLAEARERLKARLGRRGLVHDDAMLGAVFLREAQALVPPAWQEATVRAALDILDRRVAAGSVSAGGPITHPGGAQDHVLRKLTIAVGRPPGCRPDGVGGRRPLSISRDDEPPKPAPAPVAQRAAPRPAAEADPLDAAGTFPVRGRVLDPDGKPVAGAGIYVRHYAERRWTRSTRWPRGRRGAWRRPMPTAGSISSWTRVRAMARTTAA